ncbi:MAG: MATE family efflux transporter [Lachnospiraceae bacterium]|nr:MATE family efflux transporter [Lachnospiraceae bacterium]
MKKKRNLRWKLNGNRGDRPESSAGWRREFHMIWLLAVPTVIEQFLMTVVQYADTAMVGQLGAEASAAVGVTSTMMWLTNAPLNAIGIAVLAVIARHYGAGRKDLARNAAEQAVLLVGIAGVLEGILMTGLSPLIPVWLGADPSIQRNAFLYYCIVSIPMVFRASIIILGAAIRALKDTRGPMLVNVMMNILNLVLNFLLIYPFRTVKLAGISLILPGAGLGVAGAALATAISYAAGGIMMFVLFYRKKDFSICFRKIRYHRSVMRNCVGIAIPVAMERICVCLGHVVFTGQVTGFGTIALAAHSIALTAEQAFYIPGYGMQAAVSTLIGNALGERNEAKLKHISRISIAIAVAVMAVTGAALFWKAEFMMRLFTQDKAVIAAGEQVLRMVAVSEPIYGAVIILEGIYNGAGYTKTPLWISLFSMWGIRICGTWICLRLFGGGLKTAWLCMIADNVSRCILSVFVYFRGKWKQMEH